MKLIHSKEQLLELCLDSGGCFFVNNLNSAYNFCEKIANSHYENFPVGSILIPKKNRPFFYAVYAFSRIADDIADELIDETPEFRINALKKFADNLNDIDKFENYQGNPIFVALYDTIKKKQIPIETLNKLILAFIKDSDFKHPQNFDDLIDYCSYSANPIGELILRIFNQYNETTAIHSNQICTGLQLINFWQDLSIDLKKGRCYIPLENLNEFNLKKENLEFQEKNINFKSCISVILDKTFQIYANGAELIRLLKPLRLKFEIAVTFFAGMLILERSFKLGEFLLNNRPKLSKMDYLKIFFKAFLLIYGSNYSNRISKLREG